MKPLFLVLLTALLLPATAAFAAKPEVEIEALLRTLKTLEGATFIRNGDEHTAVEAEAHLRTKWKAQAEKIKTAEDFIALCGSKSSMSGDRYQIKLKDGSVKYSDELLSAWLVEIRKKSAATSAPGAPTLAPTPRR